MTQEEVALNQYLTWNVLVEHYSGDELAEKKIDMVDGNALNV